jgi:hypothetical protein
MMDISGKLVRFWPDLAADAVLTVQMEDLPQDLYSITATLEDGPKVRAKLLVK